MDRSSKAITLALIGSAALLGGTAFLVGGCGRQEEEETQGRAAASGHRGPGVFIAPLIGRGMTGGRGGVATAPSARGGFGSTGSTGSFGVGS